MGRSFLRFVVPGALVAASLAGATAVGASSRVILLPCSPLAIGKTTVHLTFWESMSKSLTGSAATSNEDTLLKLVASFNRAQAGKIVVTDVNQPLGYSQTWTKYASSLATSSAPNVVLLDQNNAQSALDTKSILPASTCIANTHTAVSSFSTKIMGAYTSGKTVAAMPFSASVPVMIYNKQAFAQAGIKTPPTTMQQLLADQTLLQKTSWTKSGVKKFYVNGVSLKYEPWEISSWLGLDNSLLVNNANGHVKRATGSVFGQSTNLRTYFADLQLIAKNAGGKNVYDPAATTTVQAYGNLFDIANGVSGITFDTTADLGSFKDYLASFKNVTLGVAPLPTLTGRNVGSLPTIGNGLFLNASNSSAAQQAASWKFVQYMTAAAQLSTWDAATGYLPVRSDAVSTWRTKLLGPTKASNTTARWFEVGYAAMTAGRPTPASEGPMIGNSIAVKNDLSASLQALLTSPFTTTPGQALSEASHNATADIVSYNSGV